VLDSSHEPLHVAAACELSNTLSSIVPAEIFLKQKIITIEKQIGPVSPPKNFRKCTGMVRIRDQGARTNSTHLF
jgi:hypothetical protein